MGLFFNWIVSICSKPKRECLVDCVPNYKIIKGNQNESAESRVYWPRCDGLSDGGLLK